MHALLLLLVPLACDGTAPDEIDEDADGWSVEAGDCDDADANVHPAATETCNSLDDDCDGAIDEAGATDASTWYADFDGDTYGDPGAAALACDAPAGYVADALDCDDSDFNVSPAATEACNSLDDDCDGAVDESGATGESTWYADFDGDTFGDPGATALACDQPADYVTDALDCDDEDANVSPAATEACNSLDDDCDGAVDESGATGESTWYADFDVDTFGDAGATVLACDQPADYVADALDCDDADANVHPTATEACNSLDDDCDGEVDEAGATGESTWYADFDGDTFGDPGATALACDQPADYVTDAFDCDDTDANINPAATEACNATDDDCDGAVDEAGATGESTWYADSDGDTFGDPGASVTACDQPVDYVTDTLDCDDTDANINPAATEACNASDDDCDGDVDEAGATGESIWYADSDGDTFGDPGASFTACDQPADHVTDGLDCDDTDANINPAATEACNSLDDDCDGVVDEAGASGESTWYADADGDTFGDAGATVLACDQPADYIVDALDCDDTDAAVNPAATEACNAVDDDCDGVDEEALACRPLGTYAAADRSAAVLGDHSRGSYWAATIEGDINGDGLNDLLVGGASGDGGSLNGEAYAVYGPVAGVGTLSAADLSWTGESAYDKAGRSLAYAGDQNQDGYDDVLVGALGDDDFDSNSGAVYLLFGGTASSGSLAGADVKLLGESGDDEAGGSVAGVGDVDNDGYDDILIGAHQVGLNHGAAYLLYGPVSADANLGTADAVFEGESLGDESGETVAGAGDVDGDGYADLLIGATNDDDGGTNAGATYLLYGPPTAGSTNLAAADAKLGGEEAGDLASQHGLAAGDFDGDGYSDLVIGASGHDGSGGTGSGAVYVVRGPVVSSRDLGSADAKISGENRSDGLGIVSSGGDIDGDGNDDLLLSASPADSQAGAAYLLYGPIAASLNVSDADVTFLGTSAGDYFGGGLAGNGDVDGDGRPDILIAASQSDEAGPDYGALNLFYASDL